MTLDEIFPSGRGDGRKFTMEHWSKNEWFEPIFALADEWIGIDECGQELTFARPGISLIDWTPPKKKITLYKPILNGYGGHYYSRHDCEWHSDKGNWPRENPIGWMEMEAEVNE